MLLNLYELIYIKICGVETDNLKCIGEIIDDKYFFNKRDENNKNNELVYSFGPKNTRFDFMLHHEYDLYKNFTYSTSEHCKDIESYTRPSYMKDLFLVIFGEADTPEGDNIKLKDFPKACSAISFAHINPKNKYWYYKILLDSGMTGREIRERELLSFNLNRDLSCEDIINCLKD
ncbi:MAG: hypothetical protein LUD77_00140 [Clostridiales bacterium]|nr:hypothetical protein [Clostridiales bacterium]